MFIPAVPAAVAGKMSATSALAHLAPALASLLQSASAARATPTAGAKVMMPFRSIPVQSRAAPVNTSLLMGNAGLWNRPTQNAGATEAQLAQAFQRAQAQKQAGMAASMMSIMPNGRPATGSGIPLVRFPGIVDAAAPPRTSGVPGGASFTCKDGSRTPNPTTCPEWQANPPQVTPTLPPMDGQGVVCTDGTIVSSARQCPVNPGMERCPDGSSSAVGCGMPDSTKALLAVGAVAVLGLGIYLATRH